uniref:CCHC-type domain-containing protein n=1 Tax=Macrostomum lignano TaxID=282301 RepID=A0A1I8IKH4_9PLAT
LQYEWQWSLERLNFLTLGISSDLFNEAVGFVADAGIDDIGGASDNSRILRALLDCGSSVGICTDGVCGLSPAELRRRLGLAADTCGLTDRCVQQRQLADLDAELMRLIEARAVFLVGYNMPYLVHRKHMRACLVNLNPRGLQQKLLVDNEKRYILPTHWSDHLGNYRPHHHAALLRRILSASSERSGCSLIALSRSAGRPWAWSVCSNCCTSCASSAASLCNLLCHQWLPLQLQQPLACSRPGLSTSGNRPPCLTIGPWSLFSLRRISRVVSRRRRRRIDWRQLMALHAVAPAVGAASAVSAVVKRRRRRHRRRRETVGVGGGQGGNRLPDLPPLPEARAPDDTASLSAISAVVEPPPPLPSRFQAVTALALFSDRLPALKRLKINNLLILQLAAVLFVFGAAALSEISRFERRGSSHTNMAQALQLTAPDAFDIDSDPLTRAQRWKTWARRFNSYIRAAGITDATQQLELLVYTAGEKLEDFMEDNSVQKGKSTNELIQKLQEIFDQKNSVVFLRYQFETCRQEEGESIDAWYHRLRKAADQCEFGELRDSLIRDKVVAHYRSEKIRRELLQLNDICLADVLKRIRAREAAEQQAQAMEENSSGGAGAMTTANVAALGPPRARPSQPFRRDPAMKDGGISCERCGRPGHRTCEAARDKACRRCGKIGHFARACRGTSRIPVRAVNEPDDRSYGQVEYLQDNSTEHELFSLRNSGSAWTQATVNGFKTTLLIDSGAACNIIDRRPSKGCHRRPGSKQPPLKLLGKTDLQVSVFGCQETLPFLVLDGKGACIIGRRSAEDLGVLRVGPEDKAACELRSECPTDRLLAGVPKDLRQSPGAPSLDEILKENAQAFDGIGCLKNYAARIFLEEGARPAAVPNALSLTSVQKSSQKDATIQAAIRALETGRWSLESAELRSLHALRHELSAVDGVLLRGQRIIVPVALRRLVLDLAHRGHQCTRKTLDRLNTKVWWPRMQLETERFIATCRACLATSHAADRTTGRAPAELLMGRVLNDSIPSVRPSRPVAIADRQLRQRDALRKAQGKLYTDRKRLARPHKLKVGDTVLRRRLNPLKGDTPFEWDPWLIEEIKADSATIRQGARVCRRHCTDLKRVAPESEPDNPGELPAMPQPEVNAPPPQPAAGERAASPIALRPHPRAAKVNVNYKA